MNTAWPICYFAYHTGNEDRKCLTRKQSSEKTAETMLIKAERLDLGESISRLSIIVTIIKNKLNLKG